MRNAWVLGMLCFTAAFQLRADTFVLADGTTIEGTIVEEGGGEVTIQSKYGKLKIKRADITEIKKQETTHEAIAKKWDELQNSAKKDDAGAWVDLGLAAKKAGLKDDMRAALRLALKLDPNNVVARQVLDADRAENGPNGAKAAVKPAQPQPPAQPAEPARTGQPSDAMTPLTQVVEAHDCPTCNGYGVLKNLPGKFKGFPCMTCNGKGKLTKVVTYDGCEIPKGYHLCALCDGKKFGTWKPCDKCGSGEMPGLVKRMSGYYICESCKGMAELPGLPCRECKGVGFVKD
ncbi:MAG: hypothetical protein HY291_03440 [Planctomycetes bacterium]|nr:hypothetical protein [Planctomycetota bacterium]